MDNLGFSLLFHLWPLAKMWIVSIVVLSGNSEKKHFFMENYMLASETRLIYLGKEERIQDRVLHRWKKLFRAAFGKNWKISPLHYRNKIGLFVSVCAHAHAQEFLADIQYQSSCWRKNTQCSLVDNQSLKIYHVILRQLITIYLTEI